MRRDMSEGLKLLACGVAGVVLIFVVRVIVLVLVG